MSPLETTVNVDETGHKENGDKFWTWVFKAELYVLFKLDKSRGSKVLIDVLGKEFNGVPGYDYFFAYRKYMKDFNVLIQFCIAYLIRDIRFLTTLSDQRSISYWNRSKLTSTINLLLHYCLVHHDGRLVAQNLSTQFHLNYFTAHNSC